MNNNISRDSRACGKEKLYTHHTSHPSVYGLNDGGARSDHGAFYTV